MNKPDYSEHKAVSSRQISELIKYFEKFKQKMILNLSARWPVLLITAFILSLLITFTDINPIFVIASSMAIFAAFALLPDANATEVLKNMIAQKQKKTDDMFFSTLQALLDALPAPTLLLTDQSIVFYMNPMAKDLFPLGREGQYLSSFIRDPDFLNAINQSLTENAKREVMYMPRVPVERNIKVTISPFTKASYENTPAQTKILLSFYDLTEQERLSQMRSDFIANASHELRTPLASVLGFIDTLQGPAKNDETARENFLNIMRQQVERMTRLIDDLLSLSRVEMLAHLKPSDIVDIKEVADYILMTLKPLAQKRDITLSLQTELDAADVQGSRDDLIQVLQNLVQNAIKYGNDNGQITIKIKRLSAFKSKNIISVSVEDDGPGIAPEHLPRLTERFYRIDTQSSRQKGGTGLGLAIVKHIVARHQGELKIESHLGKGSVFTILLAEHKV